MASEKIATSIRVQMTEDTKNFLEKLAEELGLTYNGSGSISILLQKIAMGRLSIVENKAETVQPSLVSGYLTLIKFETLLNLKGITAIVSKLIHKNNGNIYKVEVKHNSANLGCFECLIDISRDKLKTLVKDLSKIKLTEIHQLPKVHKLAKNEEINTKEKIILQMREIVNKYYMDKLYILKILDLLTDKSLPIDMHNLLVGGVWKEIDDIMLFHNLSSTFHIKIIVDNKPGKLADISKIIAENRILIPDIKLRYPGDQKAIIHIPLELETNMGEIELEKIDRVIQIIEGLGFKEVKLLGSELL